jgi:hypothetical protein
MPAFWTDYLANPDETSFVVPPDPWSVVQIGPSLATLPGILENGDVAWRKHPHRAIDKAKGPSMDGQNPKLLGVVPAEFDLNLIIWNASQLDQLNSILPSIWPNKSTPGPAAVYGGTGIAPGNGIPGATSIVGLNLTPAALAQTDGQGVVQSDGPLLIQHPALALAQITQVLVEGWTPPVRWGGKNDVKKYVIHCIEFRPAVKKIATSPKHVSPVSVNAKILPVSGPTTPPSQNGASPAPTSSRR